MTNFANFSGRTALITGAARGIGAACAHSLDAAGIAQLVLIDRDEQALASLKVSCATQIYCGDVSDPAFWDMLEPKIGPLHHAIINAGIAKSSPIAKTSFEDWRAIMAVNLDGAFLTLRAVMRAMAESGGSAVLMSSVTGLKPVVGTGAYGSSKAALAHLTKIAALEGAADKIRVNAIAPGGVDTEIWDSQPGFAALMTKHGRDKAIAMMASAAPNGRFASPEEIAQTISFLLSDAADNITGTVLSSDGGFSL